MTSQRKKQQDEDKFTLKKHAQAKTDNQKEYVRSISKLDVVFCAGPAGTGKTHLAVGMGIADLQKEKFEKLIIARPVVEAGEQIGFLPGDIEDKLGPYVRPVYDELNKFVSHTDLQTLKNSKKIEVVPIAYMRGRTFENCFIICDECQNLDFDQMKMLLTRFGLESKMVLTGDIHQSDLMKQKQGAFKFGFELFKDDPDIGTVSLEACDIQRHKLVGHMVQKWEQNIHNFKAGGELN